MFITRKHYHAQYIKKSQILHFQLIKRNYVIKASTLFGFNDNRWRNLRGNGRPRRGRRSDPLHNGLRGGGQHGNQLRRVHYDGKHSRADWSRVVRVIVVRGDADRL